VNFQNVVLCTVLILGISDKINLKKTNYHHIQCRSDQGVETASLCTQIDKNLGYVKLQEATKQRTPVIVTAFLPIAVPS
jgi:hypothetical protein